MDGAGDPAGLELGQLGLLACEAGVDGRDPESQPPLEVLGSQRVPCVECSMQLEWVPPVEAGPEEDRLPEVAHDRKMVVQVHPRHLREDRTD